MHRHFGWKETDLNQLAGATVAGHLIECGTQVTGGISTDWSTLDTVNIGYPIVEIHSDGSCTVTKSPGTGARSTSLSSKSNCFMSLAIPGTIQVQLIASLLDPARG